jgi:hypothetical protein
MNLPVIVDSVLADLLNLKKVWQVYDLRKVQATQRTTRVPNTCTKTPADVPKFSKKILPKAANRSPDQSFDTPKSPRQGSRRTRRFG